MKINDFDAEELIFAKMVNEHSHEIHKKALDKSLMQDEEKYTKKKKVSSSKWRDAIITLAIIGVILGSGVKLVDALTESNTSVGNSYGSINKIDKDIDKEIDEKIEEYSRIMGMKGPSDTQIEVFQSHNFNNPRDPNVDYNYYNFKNDIITASRGDDPVTEVRCALIAAYKIINEPYREGSFGALFSYLKESEEFANNTGFDLEKDNIWQMLGYNNMEEFQLHAREDTKVLREIYVRSSNGKRM